MADFDTSNIFFYPAKPGQNAIQNMHANLGEAEPGGRLLAMEEKWKLIYNEDHRSPNYSVSHYITYLRRYVETTNQLRAIVSGKTTERFSRKGLYDRAETRPSSRDTQRSLDSISPMSYFIRKLKLDLKLAFVGFVEEFSQAPNNGQHLLLQLLKNLQLLAATPGAGLITRGGTRGTLKMEEYKQNMIDGQDCLLCIKYSLRAKKANEELLDSNSGLLTVGLCVLSNFSRSRITALEILTLLLSGPSAVDRVLEAFTSMRIIHAESCRFKMLVNMLYTRGVSQVLFQVTCLRLLNTMLNLCRSANMRVYLQYEMEEAGLDVTRIQQNTVGDGLEFDDLRKEIWEWKMRYVDVDAILRKMKADLKVDAPGSALTEFNYDQHFGRFFGTSSGHTDNSNATTAEDGPYTKAVSHNREVWASQNSHVNADGLSRQNTEVFQGPGFLVSSHPMSNTGNNVTGFELPAYSAQRPDKEPDLQILSRAASPTNPKPTHALSGPRQNTTVADFDSGGFVSVKTELWEPYGMVISNEPAQEIGVSLAQTVGVTHNPNVENWVLASSPSSHPRHANNQDTRSNLSFVTEEEREKLNTRQSIHQDTSKLFYSPKNSGIDVGPLKWFNPGITLPDTSRGSRARSASEENPDRSKVTSSRYIRNPQTPSPDYTCTPPPDYNDSGFDNHHEENSYRPRKPSVPSMMSTEFAAKTRTNDTETRVNGVALSSTSTTAKSNFQRWPGVRRKSFSEVSTPKPNATVTDAIELPYEEFEVPPPLPPPRVLYSFDNVKTSLSSFSSGHTLETARIVPKSNNSKFLRRAESKQLVEKHSQDPGEKPASNRSDKPKHVNAVETQEKFVPLTSSQDQVAEKTGQNLNNNDSNRDYAPGIPCNRSQKSCHTSRESNLSTNSKQYSSVASSTKLPQTKFPGVDGATRFSAKSTITVTSEQRPVRQIDTKTNNIRRAYEDFVQIDHESDKSTVAEKTKPPFYDTEIPMAITITSPTPPQTMSGTNVFNKNNIHKSQAKTLDNTDKPNQSDNNNKSLSHSSDKDTHTETKDKTDTNCDDTLPTRIPAKPGQSHVTPELDNDHVHNSVGDQAENPEPSGTTTHIRQDSVLSYSSEIGRVLGELDHTLETHGWQASLKQQVKKPRPPLVAYV